MFERHDILEVRPPEGIDSFFTRKPGKLWCVGDPVILKSKLLGIVSARNIDPELALRTSELLRQLARVDNLSFIGGWHSPLEEEALRILLVHRVRVIFCLPKDLRRFVPSSEVRNRIRDGRLLLLTHCSPKAKRISRDASLRRNLLVAAVSQGLLVLAAPPGSRSLKLAQKAISLGRPVFTPQHRMNERLLSSGALPATVENIQRLFQ
ncbi:MAG: DNA-processing protein DprA [Deltaproteobacteria bacterium]|nr:DNA-processing protein DprA [Deltaproteobacteria bacterium]